MIDPKWIEEMVEAKKNLEAIREKANKDCAAASNVLREKVVRITNQTALDYPVGFTGDDGYKVQEVELESRTIRCLSKREPLTFEPDYYDTHSDFLEDHLLLDENVENEAHKKSSSRYIAYGDMYEEVCDDIISGELDLKFWEKTFEDEKEYWEGEDEDEDDDESDIDCEGDEWGALSTT